MLLELAVFQPETVGVAVRCGVERIELCTDYRAGGLSPDPDFFSLARKQFSGRIFVMIRPRPGDFQYKPEEIEQMQKAIRYFDSAGADGFVLGCMQGGSIQQEFLDMLVEVAGNKPVTFHRAIDEAEDYEEAIRCLIRAGCSRVLTSGKKQTALEGREMLACMVKTFGKQITFLAGGGIRSSNMASFKKIPGLTEVHSAAITGSGELADEVEVRRLLLAAH